MNVKDGTDSIKIVFFNDEQGYKGMRAEITGRVDYYEGKKELIGVRVRYLN
jgi:hypothetical protein